MQEHVNVRPRRVYDFVCFFCYMLLFFVLLKCV